MLAACIMNTFAGLHDFLARIDKLEGQGARYENYMQIEIEPFPLVA